MPGPVAQARRTLLQLQKDIEDASKELGRVRQEESESRSENERLRRENTTLEDDLKQKRKLIDEAQAELEGVESEAREARAILLQVQDDTETVNARKSRLAGECLGLSKEVASLRASKGALEAEIQELDRERHRKTVRVDTLKGKELEAEKKIAKEENNLARIELRRARVLGAIEEALARFRMFERRIGRLSNETGYVIGYKRPHLLDKKLRDG